jgi:hypothetical protein
VAPKGTVNENRVPLLLFVAVFLLHRCKRGNRNRSGQYGSSSSTAWLVFSSLDRASSVRFAWFVPYRTNAVAGSLVVQVTATRPKCCSNLLR